MKCLAIWVVCALVGCHRDGAGEAPGVVSTSRVVAGGTFPDNPQLASIPSDTPYAFVTFQPFPPAYLRRHIAMATPGFAKLLGETPQSSHLRAIADEIGTFDLERFEELGFSSTARMAVYGLGIYPVVRIEIADGDRVFGLVQRIAKRWGEPLPPPLERPGHRHWIIDAKPGFAALIGLTRREIVVAFAPRAVIDRELAVLLGDRKPANSLATSFLEGIAKRDHYSPQGVGFVDTAGLLGAIFDLPGGDAVPATCRGAFDTVAQGVPRMTFGYTELTESRLTYGFVVQLAPRVLRDARTLLTDVVGVDRMLQSHAAMGMAGGIDLAHLRALAPKVAGMIRDVGSACKSSTVVESADRLEHELANPLPEFLDGPVSAVVALNDMKPKSVSLDRLDGWAAVRLRSTDPLRVIAKSQLGLDVAADGQPHALPAVLPIQGHVAASHNTVALAVGPDSSAQVKSVLAATATRSLLLAMVFDYPKMGEMLAQLPSATATDLETFKQFGVGTMEVGIDDRGIYGSGAFELK